MCGGSKVFVDGNEPRFKVRSDTFGKRVNDGTHRAWVPATAGIVELAVVPHLLVRRLQIANVSDQRDQSSCIPL